MIVGFIAYVALLQLARLRRTLMDRSAVDRVSAVLAMGELDSFEESLRRDGYGVERAGRIAYVLARRLLWALALRRWTSAVLMLLVQWWLHPSPWIPGLVLGSWTVLVTAMGTFTASRHGYRPFHGNRTRKEWGFLAPALFVQVVAIAWAFVLAWDGISGWTADELGASLAPLALSVVVLGVSHVPVQVADKWGRRLRPSEFAGNAPANCILYLRSFADDDARLGAAPMDAGFLGGPIFALTRPRFEEFVTATVAGEGPMLAIGRPGERLPELGATRTYWSDHDWQEAVLTTVHRAERVLLVAGLTGGLAWEIEQLRALGMLRKALVLIPPGPPAETRRRVERAIADLGLEAVDLTHYRPEFLLAIGFDAEDRGFFYTGTGRAWPAYFYAITLQSAILRGRDEVRRRADRNVRSSPRERPQRAGARDTVRAARQLNVGSNAYEREDDVVAVAALREGLSYERASRSVRYFLRSFLADALRRSGERSGAMDVLRELVDASRHDLAAAGGRDPVYRISTESVAASEAVLEGLDRIAEIQGELGDRVAQLNTLDELAEEAQASHPDRRAQALLERTKVYLDTARLAEARRAVDEAINEAAQRNDVRGAGRAHLLRARVLSRAGEQGPAWESLVAADNAFAKARDDEWRGEAQRMMGIARRDEGDLAEATRHLIEGLRLALSVGDEFVRDSCTALLIGVGTAARETGLAAAADAAFTAVANAENAPGNS